MFKSEHLTAIAAAVNKNPEQYVANFKGAEGEDFDADKFVETFTNDLQTTRKKERETQLNRGLVTNRDAVINKIKSYDPEFEFEGNTPDEAVDVFYQKLTAQRQAAIEAASKASAQSAGELTVDEIRTLPAFQEAWKGQAAKNQEQLNAAIKAAEEKANGFERMKQELVLSTRADKIRSKVVQWANEAAINLADPAKDAALYKSQVETLLYNPVFNPNNWIEDGNDLVPVDSDGQRLKTDNFHDMTGLDLVKSVNVFGVRKYDPNQSSPSATSRAGGGVPKMDYATYLSRKTSLLASGDKAGAKKLSDDFLASTK